MKYFPSRFQNNLFWIFALGILLEILTSFFRFYYHIQSTRDTAFIAKYTFHLRIHHGYIGILLILIAYFLKNLRTSDILYRVGGAFLFSDLIHHFIVLWIMTGSPEFDFIYP